MLKQATAGQRRGFLFRLLALLVLFSLLPAGLAGAQTQPNRESISQPAVEASSVVLLEVASGQVLFSKNPHERRPQASTTKITTAIVALEHGKLTDKVKVSKKAAETPESAIWLEEGEVLTLEQLMYALMLFSANDAASAIAEHIAGSEGKFAEMMNAKAVEIGAKDSHYVNPHGLDDPNHYTSAYDLAILARYGLTKVPGFAEIVRTREKNIPWAGHPYERVLRNRNKLLKTYPGADGVKTGYTNEAGRCLVASATRGGMQLIAVVMDSPDMFKEAATLLDWGFAHFTKQELVARDRPVRQVQVKNGLANQVAARASKDVTLALTPGDMSKVKVEIDLPERLEAPVIKNQKLGIIKITAPGQPLITVDLLSDSTVARKSKWQLFWEGLSRWFRSLF